MLRISSLIATYLRTIEPEAVKVRQRTRFKRKVAWCAGVMHIVTMDQHDKWKRFGLFMHIGLEAMTGKIVWLVIWWNNSNPRWSCCQYFKMARAIGQITAELEETCSPNCFRYSMHHSE